MRRVNDVREGISTSLQDIRIGKDCQDEANACGLAASHRPSGKPQTTRGGRPGTPHPVAEDQPGRDRLPLAATGPIEAQRAVQAAHAQPGPDETKSRHDDDAEKDHEPLRVQKHPAEACGGRRQTERAQGRPQPANVGCQGPGGSPGSGSPPGLSARRAVSLQQATGKHGMRNPLGTRPPAYLLASSALAEPSPIALAIARQAASHALHAATHSFICGSSCLGTLDRAQTCTRPRRPGMLSK